MKILTNQDVAELLDYRKCIEVLENAFVDLAEGRATNRPRTHTYSKWNGEESIYCFKSMDGALPRYGVHAIRVASDHWVYMNKDGKRTHDQRPDAPGGKYVGLVILFSIQTLEPLCILQDGFVSYMRVGVTSALAAKVLSREDSRVVGLTDPKQITLFWGSGTGPSSGLGLQFAAVGQLVFRKAVELGRGYDVPTDLLLEDVHP